MASSDDDEELQRALAMSLEEHQPAAGMVDGSDDDEMRRAIALSLTESSDAQTLSPYAPAKPSVGMPSQPKTDHKSGLMGLDRKAMERERLARLQKRKRSTSPDVPSKMMVRKDGTGYLDSAPAQKQLEMPAAAANVDVTKIALPTHSLPSRPVQFPCGTIRRTWAFKHGRTNDIKIEEVLQTTTLNIAVLSAFDFEVDWIFSKLNPEVIKQIWVMNCKGKDLQEQWRKDAAAQNTPTLRMHFPPMEGQIINMHSKLMLLIHETHMRIAVPTANLNKFDWGETNSNPKTKEMWQAAVMENSVFLIDLPRRADAKVGDKGDLTFFGRELLRYLEAQQLPRNVTGGILKFDFSQTGHLAFVHCIAGTHSGADSQQTGLPGLSKAIRQLEVDNVQSLELDYAASSLGALNDGFLKNLYEAASGREISPQAATDSAQQTLHQNIRIYFPTHETVVNSTGGADCGGTNTLSRVHYDAPTFPKQCMRDYKSTRPGVLSHNKLLLARGQRKQDQKPFAWAYVGSANVSAAAWGSWKLMKKGDPKLIIRNWECGIVMRVPNECLEKSNLKDGDIPPMSAFEGTLEVPFQYPGEPYGTKRPWFFREA